MSFWAYNDGAFDLLMRVHDQHKAIEPHKWTKMAAFIANRMHECPDDLPDEMAHLEDLVTDAHQGLMTHCKGVQRLQLRSELDLAPGLMLARHYSRDGWRATAPSQTKALALASCMFAFPASVDWMYLALTEILVAYKVSRETVITFFPSNP